ncbi:MAG: nitroreductase family protein [Eubacteriales bacterium]|nr:nitroreductase family protein [Eubacteriales bacterium]
MSKSQSAVFTRYSCRDFKPEPLSEAEVKEIIAAAQAGPTARNLQNLKFNWLSDQKLIQEISDYAYEILGEDTRQLMEERGAKNLFYGAPHVLVISAPANEYAGLDSGIAAEAACIRAEEMGLASCMIAMSKVAFRRDLDKHFCDRLNFAADEIYTLSIAFGLANSKKEPHSFSDEQIRYF